VNAASVDIKDVLDTESSVGLTYETDLYVSEIPETGPDRCVGVYDTGGFDAQLATEVSSMRRPSVQVLVRGPRGDYENAADLAQAIHDLLDGDTERVVNGTTYTLIRAVAEPAFIYWDDSQRPVLTVNFNIHRTVAA
jgi:hypothetical protein